MNRLYATWQIYKPRSVHVPPSLITLCILDGIDVNIFWYIGLEHMLLSREIDSILILQDRQQVSCTDISKVSKTSSLLGFPLMLPAVACCLCCHVQNFNYVIELQ